MTYSYTSIPAIIETIVDKVRAEYDPANNKEPYYLHGHPLEIVDILSEKTADSVLKFEKFPVIALFQDIKEQVEPVGREVSLNLAIITSTDPRYFAADRYINTFNPILYPLWKLFIKHLGRSNYIDGSDFEYTKIDRLYWGKKGLYGNTGNIFNDYVDAVELENLRVKINESC